MKRYKKEIFAFTISLNKKNKFIMEKTIYNPLKKSYNTNIVFEKWFSEIIFNLSNKGGEK